MHSPTSLPSPATPLHSSPPFHMPAYAIIATCIECAMLLWANKAHEGDGLPCYSQQMG